MGINKLADQSSPLHIDPDTKLPSYHRAVNNLFEVFYQMASRWLFNKQKLKPPDKWSID